MRFPLHWVSYSHPEAAAAGEVPARTQLVANDFNATLFGVNPSSVAGSEATLRQLTVDNDERLVRTQSRPPVAWIWAGIASMVVISGLRWSMVRSIDYALC